MKNFIDLNAPTLRVDKQRAILQFCKNTMKHRVFYILGISATAIYLSASPAFSEVANCEEFHVDSPDLSPAVCSSHTYVFPESYVLDIHPIKNRIHEIFGDGNGNITTGTTKQLVDSLVGELEDKDFIVTILPWIQEIHKYTGVLPTNDNIIEFVNLQIYLKKGDYTTARSLLEGIIINAQSPYFMEKSFENLHLIPDEV